MRAEKVQKRASDVGFDWKSAREAFYKIGEETQELSRAMDGQERSKTKRVIFCFPWSTSCVF